MGRVIVDANKIAKEKNDTYVAQDHLILALIKDTSIAAILKEAGVTAEAIVRTADQVRGGKQVNSRGAESNYEALSKYARDLTAEAEQGKLDPVIGRDNEIRRCIRILSRRTKVSPCSSNDGHFS
jgi:ATP-dependent Clp protease ATP-binding subunit ClpA